MKIIKTANYKKIAGGRKCAKCGRIYSPGGKPCPGCGDNSHNE